MITPVLCCSAVLWWILSYNCWDCKILLLWSKLDESPTSLSCLPLLLSQCQWPRSDWETEKERDIEVMGGSLPLLWPASNVHNMHSTFLSHLQLSQKKVLFPNIYFYFHLFNVMLILSELLWFQISIVHLAFLTQFHMITDKGGMMH